MRKRPTLQAFRKQGDPPTPFTGNKPTSTLLDHTSKIEQKLAKLRAEVDEKKKHNPKTQKTIETNDIVNTNEVNKHKINQNHSTQSNLKFKPLDKQQNQSFEEFLQRIGMADYEKLLINNGIDSFDILKEIKQKELEEIGISKGHALKIMVSLKKEIEKQHKLVNTSKEISNQESKLSEIPVSSHIMKKQQEFNPPEEALEIIIQTDDNANSGDLTTNKRYFCLFCYQVCFQQFCNQKCEQSYNKMFEKYEQNLFKVEQLFTKPIPQSKIEAEQEQELDEMDYVTDLAFLDIESESHPRTFIEEEEEKLNFEEYGNAMGIIREAIKQNTLINKEDNEESEVKNAHDKL